MCSTHTRNGSKAPGSDHSQPFRELAGKPLACDIDDWQRICRASDVRASWMCNTHVVFGTHLVNITEHCSLHVLPSRCTGHRSGSWYRLRTPEYRLGTLWAIALRPLLSSVKQDEFRHDEWLITDNDDLRHQHNFYHLVLLYFLIWKFYNFFIRIFACFVVALPSPCHYLATSLLTTVSYLFSLLAPRQSFGSGARVLTKAFSPHLFGLPFRLMIAHQYYQKWLEEANSQGLTQRGDPEKSKIKRQHAGMVDVRLTKSNCFLASTSSRKKADRRWYICFQVLARTASIWASD